VAVASVRGEAGTSALCLPVLLRGGDEFGGTLLGAPFLFDVLGALGDIVVDFFDFASEMKILGIVLVCFE
jgi:hypothetical protein